MKKLMTLMLGLSLFVGATAIFAQDKMDHTTKKTTKPKSRRRPKRPTPPRPRSNFGGSGFVLISASAPAGVANARFLFLAATSWL